MQIGGYGGRDQQKVGDTGKEEAESPPSYLVAEKAHVIGLPKPYSRCGHAECEIPDEPKVGSTKMEIVAAEADDPCAENGCPEAKPSPHRQKEEGKPEIDLPFYCDAPHGRINGVVPAVMVVNEQQM